MPSILEYLGFGQEQQQGPSYSKYASEILNTPPQSQTYKAALNRAIELGFPRPSEAADAVMKIIDTDRKRFKEMLPPQPTGTTQLDVPLAQTIRSILPELDYLQAAPIQAPLGFKDNLPMTIQDLIPNLPPDYQLPSPYQAQQPELTFFGPGATSELLQQTTRPYIASDIVEKIMAARTRPASITQIPTGTETITYITNPVTGLPERQFATAPREILTPQQAAFAKLSPAEQKEALLKPEVEIKLPSPAERKELTEAGKWQNLLQSYKASYDAVKSSIGPVYGRAKYLQYIHAGGKGLSRQEIAFFANEAVIKNRIIQLITGAAVGVEEEKRILSEIPLHSDTSLQWEEKYKQTLKNAQKLEEETRKIMKEFGLGISDKPTGTIEWLPIER